MSLIETLREIPFDLGQRKVAETTEGKQIALRLVPDGRGKRALDVGCRAGKADGILNAFFPTRHLEPPRAMDRVRPGGGAWPARPVAADRGPA